MFRNNAPDSKPSSFPLPTDKPEVAALWQEVFNDSGEFVNLFFSRVYKPGNTLVRKKDDRIIAALQMIPYEIKTANGILPSAYLCGVCTHPSERGKGVMKTLMAEAMEVMRQKGYSISILIPAEAWLFDFYKKFGYSYPVNYGVETYFPDRQPASPDYTFIECTTDKYFPYFDRKQRERPCAVMHDAYDFETIIRDLAYDGGNAWIALRGNNPVGMAFSKPGTGNEIVIKELLYDSLPVKESLIRYMLHRYNARTAEVRVPLSAEENARRKNRPYGLACILDRRISGISDIHMALMLD
ncbi:MAG: GNAT family N-acetyltransferase [Tannerella sp.]|jgi:predicted N-acetyltransferase YhbS|nr:GNAT family N-acetyltransferase [Tannerella sp.]